MSYPRMIIVPSDDHRCQFPITLRQDSDSSITRESNTSNPINEPNDLEMLASLDDFKKCIYYIANVRSRESFRLSVLTLVRLVSNVAASNISCVSVANVIASIFIEVGNHLVFKRRFSPPPSGDCSLVLRRRGMDRLASRRGRAGL